MRCGTCSQLAEGYTWHNTFFTPFSLQEEMSDDLHVICTVTRGARKALTGMEKTSDMSREVEVKLRLWSPDKPGTNAQSN